MGALWSRLQQAREPISVAAVGEYTCGICLTADYTPFVLVGCGHGMCWPCVDKLFKASGPCPFCNKRSYCAYKNYALDEILGKRRRAAGAGKRVVSLGKPHKVLKTARLKAQAQSLHASLQKQAREATTPAVPLVVDTRAMYDPLIDVVVEDLAAEGWAAARVKDTLVVEFPDSMREPDGLRAALVQ